MSRRLFPALASALVLVASVPSVAIEHNITGFLQTRFIMADLSLKSNQNPDWVVDQRLRVKWTLGLNDYVSAVYFGEVDFQFGDKSYETRRNDGGALGGDTVNIETKNVYLDVKIPNTPVSTRVGLQSFWDQWDSVFFDADMAGVRFDAAFESWTATAAWFKWYEGEDSNNSPGGSTMEDDLNTWALQLGFTPRSDLKLGLDGYYLNDNGGGGRVDGPAITWTNADLFYIGPRFAFSSPDLNINGWFLYNAGSLDDTSDFAGDAQFGNQDVSGWGASAKGVLSVAGVDVGLRLLYFNGDDDITDDYDAFVNPISTETFFLWDDNLILLGNDEYWTTYGQYGFANTEALYKGFGLWGGILSGTYRPPTLEKLYLKGGLGYFASVEDDVKEGDPRGDREGTSVGTEVAGRIGYAVADIVDVSINGAYAWLGDFFDGFDDGKDPDNPYQVYAMVRVSFR